jgi:hypothetical protein
LSALDDREHDRFMRELGTMLLSVPVIGFACTVDRPGYNKRYREKYGRQTWMLCRTAFAVVVERAAKYAVKNGCRLRVYVEEGDKSADDMIREYYKDLSTKGMPFASDAMTKYAPLSQVQLAQTLYDLDFKSKSSPMAQIANLYAYPMARGGYDPDYFPYTQFKQRNKLIDCLLTAEEVPHHRQHEPEHRAGQKRQRLSHRQDGAGPRYAEAHARMGKDGRYRFRQSGARSSTISTSRVCWANGRSCARPDRRRPVDSSAPLEENCHALELSSPHGQCRDRVCGTPPRQTKCGLLARGSRPKQNKNWPT